MRTLTRIQPPASTERCPNTSWCSTLSGPPCRSQRVSVQRLGPPTPTTSTPSLQLVFVRCSLCCPVCLPLLVAALCITAPLHWQANVWARMWLPLVHARQRVWQDLCKSGGMMFGCVTGVLGRRDSKQCKGLRICKSSPFWSFSFVVVFIFFERRQNSIQDDLKYCYLLETLRSSIGFQMELRIAISIWCIYL